MSGPDDLKSEIREFWGSLYRSLYSTSEATLDSQTLLTQLQALEEMFLYRRHLAVVEMPLEQLAGLSVLEIGSGAGGHSALFAARGARVTSVDITLDRVRSTQNKFNLLGERAHGSRALQADCEHLPFADGSFDIVYSNGVLHHTADTESAIGEVRRVLKPGGDAVIMLYCKSSWHYWFNLFLCVGILQGKLFTRGKRWLGEATEWGGVDRQKILNPITRCYTLAGIRRLFSRFRPVSVRKADFYFYLIPKFGRLWRKYQICKYGTHEGGMLVYGAPWPVQSPLELRLGKSFGFAWFIKARKPPR